MLYHTRQAWLALRANLTAGLATLTTMTLTLVLLGLVSLTAVNLERIVRSIESEVTIAAFLEPSNTADEARTKRERVQLAVQEMPIESLTFRTKEEVYADLTKDYPYLSDASRVVVNPLSDEIRVKLISPGDIASVAERIRRVPGVTDVEYGQAFVGQLVSALSAVRTAGYGLVGLLIANSLFNILNTIRVAMYARRDEINVMRLIGATRAFIRAPYLLEGLGLGLLAGLLTAAVVYPLYMAGAERLQALAPFLPVTREPAAVWRVLGLEVLLGVGIGLLGSLAAANRYLREVE